MEKPVAIVQHQPSVPPGSIESVLRGSRVEHFVLEAWREATWPAAVDLGALVVLGGTMNVDQIDSFPFIGRSRVLMAEAVDREIPVLGVCLGSQMLARVLDAPVVRSEPRNATFSPVRLTPEGERDEIVGGFTPEVPVLQFHEDTFEVPKDAVALATSSTSGTSQAFRYGINAYAVQFHFEVDRPIVEGWLADIGPESMKRDWGVAPDELLRQVERHLARQRVAGARLVEGFLALAAVRPTEGV